MNEESKARLARNKEGCDDEEGENAQIRNNRRRSLIIVPNIVAVFPSRCTYIYIYIYSDGSIVVLATTIDLPTFLPSNRVEENIIT